MRRFKIRGWVNHRYVEERETVEEQMDRLLKTKTFMSRHPAPFNKTRAGMVRRKERKFVIAQERNYVEANCHSHV